MRIIQFDPSDHYRVQQFIDLPFRLYRNVEQWIPPLITDMKEIFDDKKNPFYQHSTVAYFLAVTEDGSSVGRLAVLNNHNYNNYNHSQAAFFCLFECIDEKKIAYELFNTGISWARNQGLNLIIGPRGFTALDGLGLLIKGFSHRPAFGIAYNHEYYAKLIESSGFEKDSDIVSGYLCSDTLLPEKIHKISDLVQQRRGLKIINFHSKSALRKMIPQIMEMYNNSLEGTIGNVPLTENEVKKITDQLIWFANPRLIKIIQKDDRVVGFLFAYPDISEAVQRVKGQVFPFGWIQLVNEMKRTQWVNINGVGILEEFQGLGGTALLFSEVYKSIIDGGFKHAELVQIGVDNDKMQRELRDMGIDFYKIHRLYKRII